MLINSEKYENICNKWKKTCKNDEQLTKYEQKMDKINKK